MSSPLHHDVEQALTDLRTQQERIRAIGRSLVTAQTTAQSKDKTVEATVNSQGALLTLKFRGERYRDLPPAELGAKIVEVVRDAQTKSQVAAAAALSEFIPQGMPMGFAEAEFDFDAMFDEAVERAKQPLFPGDVPMPADTNGDAHAK